MISYHPRARLTVEQRREIKEFKDYKPGFLHLDIKYPDFETIDSKRVHKKGSCLKKVAEIVSTDLNI